MTLRWIISLPLNINKEVLWSGGHLNNQEKGPPEDRANTGRLLKLTFP